MLSRELAAIPVWEQHPGVGYHLWWTKDFSQELFSWVLQNNAAFILEQAGSPCAEQGAARGLAMYNLSFPPSSNLVKCKRGKPREEQDLLFLVSQLDPSLWGMRCCHRQVFLRTVLLVHPQRYGSETHGEREAQHPRCSPSCSPLALRARPVSFWFKLLTSQSPGLTECVAVSSAHPNPLTGLLCKLSGATEVASPCSHRGDS